MNYSIKRDLNEYGPYTLADLQKYIASGNILLTDLCRSEGLTDWVPVSQVIGNIPVPATPQPPSGPPAYAPVAVSPYPPPPNLHWAICLLLTVITCSIFGWVWAMVQAVWVRKVQPNSKGLLFYSVALGIDFLFIAYSFYYGLSLGFSGAGAAGLSAPSFYILRRAVQLAVMIAIVLGNFNMRDSIEEHFNTAEPIGLGLSGVMTFFFGILYFQYHFTKINEMKQRQMGYSV
jgi:hypothetical protein